MEFLFLLKKIKFNYFLIKEQDNVPFQLQNLRYLEIIFGNMNYHLFDQILYYKNNLYQFIIIFSLYIIIYQKKYTINLYIIK